MHNQRTRELRVGGVARALAAMGLLDLWNPCKKRSALRKAQIATLNAIKVESRASSSKENVVPSSSHSQTPQSHGVLAEQVQKLQQNLHNEDESEDESEDEAAMEDNLDEDWEMDKD
ncbi:hypothetical protein DXG03_000751, partial [Asterophora parasitica]